jgi:hypothetical protein
MKQTLAFILGILVSTTVGAAEQKPAETAASPSAAQPSAESRDAAVTEAKSTLDAAWEETRRADASWEETKRNSAHISSAIQNAGLSAWDDVKEATYAQRLALRDRLRAVMSRVDIKIQEWELRRQGLTGEARATADTTLAELRDARNWVIREVDDLNNATPETWTTAKTQVGNAWQRVKSSYNRLEAQLSAR